MVTQYQRRIGKMMATDVIKLRSAKGETRQRIAESRELKFDLFVDEISWN